MADTGSYIPPQSPIAIQPGDKGFEIVGKGYNRWLWTYPDWKNSKKKIIDPNANWGLNAKPMSPSEIKKKMKGLYLQEDSDERIEGGLSSGKNLREIAILHTYDDSMDHVDRDAIEKMLSHLKDQLAMGIRVEMEHTDDESIASEIAKDHLTEDPDYYSKLKKIEEKMKHVVNFDSFLNESKILETEGTGPTTTETDPIGLGGVEVSVVKTQVKKGNSWKTINGAIRLSAPGKPAMDYKIKINSFIYTGPVVPTYLKKKDKSSDYVMGTNANQSQDLTSSDMNKVIAEYKAGKTSIKIPGTIADITFTKTGDFASLK